VDGSKKYEFSFTGTARKIEREELAKLVIKTVDNVSSRTLHISMLTISLPGEPVDALWTGFRQVRLTLTPV
jgi:hypothetical protein